MTTPQPDWNQAGNSQALDAAYAAAQAGNVKQAVGIAADVVRQQPANEKAWLLLASMLDDRDRKRQCLYRVLAINPNNHEARVGLSRLEMPPVVPVAASPPTAARQSLPPYYWDQPKRRRSSRVVWWAVAGIVAFMFMVCIGPPLVMRFLLVGGSAPPTTHTGDAAAPPAPRPTPSPTATRVIPARQSDGRTAYFDDAVRILVPVTAALKRIAELDSNPQLDDPGWNAEIRAQTAVLASAYTEMKQLVPPADLAYLHTQVLDALQTCTSSMYYLESGIDNMDLGDLKTSSALAGSCESKFTAVNSTLDALNFPAS